MKPVQKRQFLKVFKLKAGNITKSCDAVNISRQCYYNWLRNDLDFLNKVNEIQASTIDEVEDHLMQLIRSNHPGSIMFYLKCKGDYTEPPRFLVQNADKEAKIMIDHVINNIISVVSKHILDPKRLKLIADEIKTIPGNKE